VHQSQLKEGHAVVVSWVCLLLDVKALKNSSLIMSVMRSMALSENPNPAR
jgi:hypothetical protein